MVTGDFKNSVDRLWTEFWTGGITNPLTVIEQISLLIYVKVLDDNENNKQQKANILNIPYKSSLEFTGNDEDEKQIYKNYWEKHRWSKLQDDSNSNLLQHAKNLFIAISHIKTENSQLSAYMQGVSLEIPKQSLLTSAIDLINELDMTKDTKGDLYEYLLSKLSTAGINGQFRTPRHIINTMVQLLNPNFTQNQQPLIVDPACGTGGFLMSAFNHLKQQNPTDSQVKHLNTNALHGFDFDNTMLRVSAMNLFMHGIQNPKVFYQDTLAKSFNTNHNKQYTDEYFDYILANPPFKGSLDKKEVSSDLKTIVDTSKTELLFLALILNMLKNGGEASVIIPDGVLFGTSKAHIQIRKELIENNTLQAVVSLPSGVFKPYAGVSTAILFFKKGGKTEDVLFFNLENDGFSLDDKRQPIQKNDIPLLITSWDQYFNQNIQFTNRKAKTFTIPKSEILSNNYDLSITKYKQLDYIEPTYDSPHTILTNIETLQQSSNVLLKEIKTMLGGK